MKNLLSKPVVVRVDGENFKGIVLQDLPDRVVLQSEKDGKTINVTIIKNKISMFMTNGDVPMQPMPLMEKPVEKPVVKQSESPITVYACQNVATGCVGVRYLRVGLKEGEGVDCMDFMSPCPCKSTDCKSGGLGDMSKLKFELVSDMLDRLMLGAYPEPKKKRGRPRKNAEGTEEPAEPDESAG